MEFININNFLRNYSQHGVMIEFTEDGYKHYFNILNIIQDKFLNPKNPESSFVESVFSENWERAYFYADTRNKDGIKIDLFKSFVKSIKLSPLFIEMNRNKVINDIF